MFDPSLYHALDGEQAHLVRQVIKFTQEFFQDPRFDASHDFNHVLRVTALAIKLLEREQRARSKSEPPLDALTVILAAVLHDVDDKKYRQASQLGRSPAYEELVRLGVDEPFASKIQTLIEAVSYSSEVKNMQRVRDLLVTIPELAVVQDADRLDAIGAVGIGRVFAYGAVKTSRSLDGSIEHFEEKLFKLEGMMKTDSGREIARRYSARLKQFKAWWDEETEFAHDLP